MNVAPTSVRPRAVESQKSQHDTGVNFLAQAGGASANGSNTATAATTHRRLLEEMKQDAQALNFSLGEFFSTIGQNFNPDGPLRPRQALGMMLLAYEEGVGRFAAGDPQISLRDLTDLSNAVNTQLTAIQNNTAKDTAIAAQFGADVAGFVRSMSVGVAAGVANQIGGPPLSALVGGMTSVATLTAMAGSARLHGVPLEQLDLPTALINDAGNLLTTIGAPHLLAFFNLPAAPAANTMRGIVMHMVRQGGADAALDSIFVAFTEATLKNQPIPDALRAGALQGVFSFLGTAGFAGAIGAMDAGKSQNFAKMIEVLDDNDASRLMAQFGPEQARALHDANPAVYRALNGRTDGALDEMLGVGQGGSGATPPREVELVEVNPGEFQRARPDAVDRSNSGTEALNRRPAMQPDGASGRQQPRGAASAPNAGAFGGSSTGNASATVRLGGDDLVVSRRGEDLVVTVPGGNFYTLPEGMKLEDSGPYLQNLYLRGSLPGYEPPRHLVPLGGQDFAVLGADRVYGVETPDGEVMSFRADVVTRAEAERRLRNAWLNGAFEGFGPPRTPLALGNAQFSVAGETGGPFLLQREGGGSLLRIDAQTADEAVHKAGRAWLSGQVDGFAPPASRLTLDADRDQVITILGGGRGPFALGNREGRYITDLASGGSNAVTSLDQASEMVKEAWRGGLLESLGFPGPSRAASSAPVRRTDRSASAGTIPPAEPSAASTTATTLTRASVVAPGLSNATADFPNPTDLAAVLRFTQDDWGDGVADLPPATREAMRRTVEMALERSSDEWTSAPSNERCVP